MYKRPYAVVLTAVGAALLQACAHNLGKHCSFSTSQSLTETDSSALGVVVGAPANLIADKPFVTIYTPSSKDQELALKLDLVPASLPWPNALNESRCRDLDWRTYRVVTDSEQWQAFWGKPKPLAFEISLALFPDSHDSKGIFLPYKSFAVAWVDATTGEPLHWCGCYRT